MILKEAEADAIEARIARVEARTGVQVVTAVAGRSDGYPEIVWKAFAFGVAVAAAIVVVMDLLHPEWVTAETTLLTVLSILAVAAVSAVVAIAVPEYGRRFLNGLRAAGEVRQFAQAMFLERRLFHTRSRRGVLVFASLYERQVEIVADIGFDGRVDAAQWRSVVDVMRPALAAGRTSDAFLHALERIEALLVECRFDPVRDGRDELANRPIDAGERS